MSSIINPEMWAEICQVSLISLLFSISIFFLSKERKKYFENYIAKEHYTCGEPIKYIKKGDFPEEGYVLKESLGENANISINWEKDCIYMVIFIIALLCLISLL